MKKFLTAGVCLASFLSLGNAFAGSVDVKVTLPHAAAVGSSMLPAGEYRISEIKGASGAPVLVFHSDAGLNVSALANPMQGDMSTSADQTELVLRQVGNRFEIDKIWIAGENRGFQLLTER